MLKKKKRKIKYNHFNLLLSPPPPHPPPLPMEPFIKYFNSLKALNKEVFLFIAQNIVENSFKMRPNPTLHELRRTDDWYFILHVTNNRTV